MGSPAAYDLQGQGGGVVVTSASGAVAGRFRWLQVVNDAVISDITSSNLTSSSGLEGITIPAGVGIGGLFEGVTLTSGVVVAYYS